jgi:hypothetical protein
MVLLRPKVVIVRGAKANSFGYMLLPLRFPAFSCLLI